ncbi:MAG: 1-acyl-sn-glycerol-3-phosphate acyltransferase [Bacteroidetes bacterium]|nr:1-acyl-sn-glycerol-3-phosphate acyltransferase [Bacteroidota bacterium]
MLMRFYRVFYKFVLSRRYRVTISGIDLLKQSGSKLILPNHQSHVDPQIIAVECYKYADVVPVVNERFFRIPVIKFFLRKWGAVSVSDFRSGNRDPHVLKTIFSKVIVALEEGKTVIIYPSGQLQETGIEKINNKQSAYAIVKDLPKDTRVLGVRIKGLWGSSFSWAWNGKKPAFLKQYLFGVFYFFSNLIFLCPKRDVSLEFFDITEEAKKESLDGRHSFNRFLEKFYNVDGRQAPLYVKHVFFFPKSKRKLPESIVRREAKELMN